MQSMYYTSESVYKKLKLLGCKTFSFFNYSCHNLGPNAYIRILPNYCATYLPIAVVMVVNPLLYSSSSQDVEITAARALGQFTSKERAVVDALRLKFFAINAVFYFCWLPNLINGILLWTLWFNLPVKVVTSLWYIMVSLPAYLY
jgi:ocular albinism type 1 protein